MDQRLAFTKLDEAGGQWPAHLEVLRNILHDLAGFLVQVQHGLHLHWSDRRQHLRQLRDGRLHELEAQLLIHQEYPLVNLREASAELGKGDVTIIILVSRIMMLKPIWESNSLDDELQGLRENWPHLLQRYGVVRTLFVGGQLRFSAGDKRLYSHEELSEEGLHRIRDLVLLVGEEPEYEGHQRLQEFPRSLGSRCAVIICLHAEIHIGFQRDLAYAVEQRGLLLEQRQIGRIPVNTTFQAA
mmetsp:Transcript_14872/g.34784  ORF Transcript_14872/g.34784 Transcript_14872/m.34784 type:complete len:242 (+) Transcript_14872:1570-2295(+)